MASEGSGPWEGGRVRGEAPSFKVHLAGPTSQHLPILLTASLMLQDWKRGLQVDAAGPEEGPPGRRPLERSPAVPLPLGHQPAAPKIGFQHPPQGSNKLMSPK